VCVIDLAIDGVDRCCAVRRADRDRDVTVGQGRVDVDVVREGVDGAVAAFVDGESVVHCDRSVVDGIDCDADGGGVAEVGRFSITDAVCEAVARGLAAVVCVVDLAVDGVDRCCAVRGSDGDRNVAVEQDRVDVAVVGEHIGGAVAAFVDGESIVHCDRSVVDGIDCDRHRRGVALFVRRMAIADPIGQRVRRRLAAIVRVVDLAIDGVDAGRPVRRAGCDRDVGVPQGRVVVAVVGEHIDGPVAALVDGECVVGGHRSVVYGIDRDVDRPWGRCVRAVGHREREAVGGRLTAVVGVIDFGGRHVAAVGDVLDGAEGAVRWRCVDGKRQGVAIGVFAGQRDRDGRALIDGGSAVQRDWH